MKLLDSSNYENIIAYMQSNESQDLTVSGLTEHEQQLCIRWNEAWTLIRNYHSTSDAAAILMKRFPISRATAFRDCANAMSLFGDLNKSNKEGIKHLSTEMIKDGAKIHRAMNDGDGLIKAGVAIAKVNGVNVTDPDLPDFKKLEPHTFNIVLDDLATRAIHYLISTGRIDLTLVSEAMQIVAEDVEFTEVKKIGDGV
jgi:hypothetical protein